MAAEIIPIRDAPNVIELLKTLNDGKVEVPLSDFTAMLSYIGAIEKQLDTVVDELRNVKQTLDAVQHPAKSAFRTMVSNLETQVNDVQEQLNSIKQSVIESVKQALETIKEKGLAALSGIMKLFKVQDKLDAIKDNLENAAKSTEKLADKLENLERTVAQNRTKKPSLLGRLEENKAIVAARKAAPVVSMTKKQEVSL